ncbi:MAG: MBL fold metallo-hydrolase [Hydrogenibacillus schlegelii]|nr:MBL fold metallo-hydrolase [Hydrogenibacillus schlegelii]
MQLTVLGFWGAYPEAEGATAGYLLEIGRTAVLLDVGSGVLGKLMKYRRPKDLEAVIVTHFHHDHVADLGVLQYAMLLDRKAGGEKELPIYAPPSPEATVRAVEGIEGTTLIPIREGDRLEIGGGRFSFLRTVHPVETLAVRVEADGKAIVYTSDTRFFPELVAFSRGADLLIAESSVYAGEDGTPAGHMNAEEAGRLAAEAEVRRLVLTHLPHYGMHHALVEGAAAVFSGPVHLAHTGARYGV